MNKEIQNAIDFIHTYMHPTGDDEIQKKKLKYRDMAIKALENEMYMESTEMVRREDIVAAIGRKPACYWESKKEYVRGQQDQWEHDREAIYSVSAISFLIL